FAATCVSVPVISALTGLLLFQWALHLGFSIRSALMTAWCYGLATIAWPYAAYFQTEPIATLATLGAAYAAYRFKTGGRYWWLYLSGLSSGVAASSRETALLLVALPVGIYLLITGWEKAQNNARRSRWTDGAAQVVIFLLGLLPFLFLNLWYNFA